MADEEGRDDVEGTSSREEVEITNDGTVDFRGRPAIRAKTGGWKTSWFIYCFCGVPANQVFANMGFYGCSANLVRYLTSVMHQSNATASTNVSNWNGVGYITPLIGAFLADAYWGRYWASFVFTFIFVIGMIFLTVSASLPSLRPQQCATQDLLCPQPSSAQAAFLFFSLYIVDLGAGAFQCVVTPLGADQFDDEDPEEKAQKTSFFNWYYQSMNMGGLLAGTFLIYIQDNVSWGLGFGASLIAVVIGTMCFLGGTPFYRHNLPGGNPITRITQVIVASVRKWYIKIPISSELYEVPEEMESIIQGSRKIRHTNEFRFLDKAAVEMDGDKSDDSSANPWRLCTITQVEEVKVLVRMIPITITSAMFSTIYNQMSTVFVLQGATMDLRMGYFNIPPASLTVVELLSVSVWVPIYDFFLIRLASKFTNNPRGFTELQRIGIGLLISVFSMVAAALLEIQRLEVARLHELLDDPTVPVPLSVFWQIPQYFFVGAAEVFTYVGIYEFFYGESPDAMRGLGTAFALLTVALGSFLSSVLLTIVTHFTSKDGAPGWIADNLNRGHLDYFFWLLAGMSTVNLVFYVVCARWYTTKQTWGPSKPATLSSGTQ
ncbi:protein NRT1/ PTR FAMILY 8.1 isoform X3 [Physcomitrium patens]|uniref:protein NRT1/ PTR FAMILY 8.1 isoform X3 n=1 Tax=Physcomitrium patens TaxID=3218 RepID=UPI000D1537F7|nr:protein NRT1/ PTR FAMILY 8.1-like isoform X3 [Physcomitrium patens]|eukprot:XP_024375102.1 protein NRT1/ PTR FAMILY 8.1-like isoform X3 [Physcomitrella patens]